jgi:hypothetical protein
VTGNRLIFYRAVGMLAGVGYGLEVGGISPAAFALKLAVFYVQNLSARRTFKGHDNHR